MAWLPEGPPGGGSQAFPSAPIKDQINTLLDLYLLLGVVFLLLAGVIHALTALLYGPDRQALVMLGADGLSVLLLLAGLAFRRLLGPPQKLALIILVVTPIATLSFIYNGLLGSGTILICTVIMIVVVTVRPRVALVAVGSVLLVFPLLALLVFLGVVSYAPQAALRVNSPLTWIFHGIIMTGFACISGITVNTFRSRLLRHIHELDRSRARVERLAFFDSLTGLPNRHRFEEYLRERLSGRGVKGFVVLLDIKAFRVINAMFGNDRGDRVLRTVAELLQAEEAHPQYYARIGGDEFALWIEGVDGEELQREFGRFCAATDRAFPAARHGHRISYYCGVSSYPDDGDSFEVCWRRASIALRWAKEHLREGMVFFAPEMLAGADETLRLQNLLERAIQQREFRIAYQPKVDVHSGKILGVEALARWDSPELGSVSPSIFIPAILRAHLTIPFSRLIFTMILEQMPEIERNYGQGTPVAINASAHFFGMAGFSQYVIDTITRAGVNPSQIIFEITEDVLIEDMPAMQQVLCELTRFGVGVSLDDFGTGFSSLYCIHSLAFTELKIDRSFVEHICSDEKSFKLFHLICSVATLYGLTIVAEGVETQEQADKLKETFCSIAQGFHYARPEILCSGPGQVSPGSGEPPVLELSPGPERPSAAAPERPPS